MFDKFKSKHYLCARKANRGVAQLAARHVRDVEVGSSSLLTPTQCLATILLSDSCEVFDFSAGTKTGRLFLNIRTLFQKPKSAILGTKKGGHQTSPTTESIKRR